MGRIHFIEHWCYVPEIQRCTEKGFPHGLRCANCNKPIAYNEMFIDRPVDVATEPIIVELICLECRRAT